MANTTASAAPAAKQAQVTQTVFRTGTQPTYIQDGYQVSATLGATAQQLATYNPDPNNYFRGLYIQVTGVAAGNSATTAFNADAPWNVIQQITLNDTGNRPFVGPLSGYELMIIGKFGAYQYVGDPRASATYSVTTGSGGSGGSFSFTLYIPVEVNLRGFGAQLNQSSSSTFSVQTFLNTEANVYSTSPTAAPAVTVTITEAGWWKGQNSAASQTPPAAGSVQYWLVESHSSLNSTVQFNLAAGLGFDIRLPVFLNYDVSAGTRATGDTDFPTQLQLQFNGTQYANISKSLLKHLMSQAYGYTSTTADAALGLENGVYTLPWFCTDIDMHVGNENALGYLVTNQGELNQFLGTFNGNSNLFYLCNYVAPLGSYTGTIQGKV